jgi:hypothetical protein
LAKESVVVDRRSIEQVETWSRASAGEPVASIAPYRSRLVSEVRAGERKRGRLALVVVLLVVLNAVRCLCVLCLAQTLRFAHLGDPFHLCNSLAVARGLPLGTLHSRGAQVSDKGRIIFPLSPHRGVTLPLYAQLAESNRICVFSNVHEPDLFRRYRYSYLQNAAICSRQNAYCGILYSPPIPGSSRQQGPERAGATVAQPDASLIPEL